MSMLDSGARHTAHAAVCRIDSLLLLATGKFAGVGGARVKCVGRIILKKDKKVHKQTDFKMKSNGCRDDPAYRPTKHTKWKV